MRTRWARLRLTLGGAPTLLRVATAWLLAAVVVRLVYSLATLGATETPEQSIEPAIAILTTPLIIAFVMLTVLMLSGRTWARILHVGLCVPTILIFAFDMLFNIATAKDPNHTSSAVATTTASISGIVIVSVAGSATLLFVASAGRYLALGDYSLDDGIPPAVFESLAAERAAIRARGLSRGQSVTLTCIVIEALAILYVAIMDGSILLQVMAVVAFCAHGFFARKIVLEWRTASLLARAELVVLGLIVPPLVGVGGVIAIGLALAAAVTAIMGIIVGGVFQGGYTTSDASSGHSRDIRDKYGNRLGSITADGSIRDKYGNSVGSIRDGEIRDQYGNKLGSIE